MRPLLLRILALALTVAVVAFVVQVSRTRAREMEVAVTPEPSASAPTKDAGPPAAAASVHNYGIIGPATKADPHVMRRAAEAALGAPSASADAP